MVIILLLFAFQISFGEDEFKLISAPDEFISINNNLVSNEKVKTDMTLIKAFIDNNIIYLTAGILLAAAAFFLKLKRARYLIMLGSLIFFGFYIGGCSCSMGSFIKFFYNIIFDRTNLLVLSLLAFIPVASAFLFGRVFCGYICPIGILQEFVAVKDKLIKIKPAVEKKLKHLRIILFAFIIIISVIKNEFIFNQISPFKALFNLTGNYTQIALALLILALSLFIYRPFCRFGCPLSLALEFAGKFSVFKINKNKIFCQSCRRCENKCPVNAITDHRIKNSKCIKCGECLSCIKE